MVGSHPPQARHGRETFFIEGESPVGPGAPPFRFSRVGPRGNLPRIGLRRRLAAAMTRGPNPSGALPAGYTYLGQFVIHDLTFDATRVTLGDDVSPADLLQGRSPTLDLDALYGAGPRDEVSKVFYRDDAHLKTGRTTRVDGDVSRDGFDLPRVGTGPTAQAARQALVPDRRNDENLAVAQTHAAMIRFHNRVVDTLPDDVPRPLRFRRARHRVTLHYQWMLRHDYLPRICDPDVVDDVFTHGRRVVEPDAGPFAMPTMPVESAVAALRFGHSMVRERYSWNPRFPDNSAALPLLFTFSATSGDLGGFPTLPSNWIADWRHLFRFADVGRDDLGAPVGQFNRAKRIDPRLTDGLSHLPAGSFAGAAGHDGLAANLAFRNLTRAGMVRLASGQQMAELLLARGAPVTALTADDIMAGDGGPTLRGLTDAQRESLVERTPLWFYVLREAERAGGVLAGVGARLVAETFHRAMEGSRHSIVRDPSFRPFLGEASDRFDMADLLLFAFEGKRSLLAPLAD